MKMEVIYGKNPNQVYSLVSPIVFCRTYSQKSAYSITALKRHVNAVAHITGGGDSGENVRLSGFYPAIKVSF